uniref:RRM domain-containing protein n=1 Tax=Caenorhabditis japonica TaxID=281687 RepID=A0A8R1DS54_CAEJA
MKHEPTLMMGDLPSGFDYSHMDALICNTNPKPQRVRDSLTKDKSKHNRFYQYENFEEARTAWKLLNGMRIPSIYNEFELDLTFTMQDKEYCAFFSILHYGVNRLEIYTIMNRYPSILGVAHHRKGYNSQRKFHTSCMVRFYDKEDCMQAVRELNGVPFEKARISMTVAARDIDELKEYVWQRESPKLEVGVPLFQNIYEKREVTQQEFNDITINSESFFEDLEASRWTDIALQCSVKNYQYSRQSTLNYFKYF